jgi:hypothetical protein
MKTTASTLFPKGSRVREKNPAQLARVNALTVVGASGDGKCVWAVRDGCKTPFSIHYTFIEHMP